MTKMAEVRQEVFPGDERAAGVISGADPYRELELYLEKVNEEFGEVFERWLGGEVGTKQVSTLPRTHSSALLRPTPQVPLVPPILPVLSVPPVPPVRTKRSRLLNGPYSATNGTLTRYTKPVKSSKPSIEWSNSEMHDFELLIARELSQLEQEAEAAKCTRPASLPAPATPSASLLPVEVPLFPLQATEELKEASEVASIKPKLSSPEKLKAFFSTSPFKRLKKQPKKKEADAPLGVKNLLTQLKPPPVEETHCWVDSSDPDSGLDSVFAGSVSHDQDLGLVSTATQTSPNLSRSSSFTWLSDCSSLALEYKSSSSSSPSTSPSRSPSNNDCLSDGYFPHDDLDSSPDSTQAYRISGRGNKCSRKETWEKIRRRNSELLRLDRTQLGEDMDVWVRRESVYTQTVELTPTLLSNGDEDEDEDGRVAGRPPLPPAGGSLPRPQHLLLAPPSSHQLPSPSSASLKMVTAPLPPDLSSKSSSAPMIMKKPACLDETKHVTQQPRSQSERQLAEIEAAETCKWLRAAGFPQYAQMFEDLQFPIEVSSVQKDHPFLDKDSLQSLFRRLQALNRCAKMKIDNSPKTATDESDEEEQCALSDNWTFQPESRRWSRVCKVATDHPTRINAASHEGSEVERLPDKVRYGSLPPSSLSGDTELLAARFRRTGSERLRDGAKALLRRMESLKSRRRKKQHRQVVIGDPQVVDLASMQQRVLELQCVDVSPCGSPQPLDDSSSYCSDQSSETPTRSSSKLVRTHRIMGGREDTLSDTEVTPSTWRQRYFRDANSNHTKMEFLDGRSKGALDEGQDTQVIGTRSLPRGGSLNLGGESQRYRKQVSVSLRRKQESCLEQSGSSELTEDSSSTIASQPDSDQDTSPKHKTTVVRWHSFQRSRPVSFHPWLEAGTSTRAMSALSSGQLLVLRKLALLKLTACMERHCPTHRTGWNWDLPKFIRKIKPPDYKDKTVFGVPLLLSLQRSGQALPSCIQSALRWLRANALDQVGIFRKSGVRSRIQTLKVLTEDQGEEVSFDGQQAYDVADMVKQYFRELPEALVTNKLSGTFISIFQHVPVDQQSDAVQWALLLLPDEHREALQTIVEFLHQVSVRCCTNQMTASNLAVCLAPSLFHLHTSSPSPARSSSTSPRRRKTVGAPDQKELGENKAAHDCLLHLIREHRSAFVVSEEMFTSCRFSTLEASVPMTLEELGAELSDGWRDFMRESTHAFLKEVREKSRGWVNATSLVDSQTEVAYKKVGDGHPLRLWRVSTEVEAPPQELLRRVLRERHVWDPNLLKWRVVERLDPQAEIFQFVCASMPPLPAKDYCVLRSWRGDLAKGACVIVETSVEHQEAPVLQGGVRGVVLASRYLIEPCGSGKSRIVHLSRVDTKGRSPDWYNKSYGHICAMQLTNIRNSFRHTTHGPESKV